MKAVLAALAALVAVPAAAQDEPGPAPDYRQDTAWLCLPGRADACGTPLGTTALNANGYGSVGQSRPDPAAEVDCFYVYPTVSRDPGLYSDLQPGIEENGAAAVQFARFASACRTFAPIYRQYTVAGLRRALAGEAIDRRGGAAYDDVLAAWRDFARHRNQGRPFVLVGHSQGSIHLSRLLAEEIEGSPAAERMLSAMLVGYNIEVPQGALVGGTFKRTPLCTRAGQTGCVISYVSFRATNPPAAVTLFGRSATPGMTVACTNPAALGSRGSAPLDSYWFTAAPPVPGAEPIGWSSQGAPPTPFVRTEGLASAACVQNGNVGYLSVLTNADPSDARTDRIPGDVVVDGKLQPIWGLHLGDVSLAQGDLIRLVEQQAAAFARR